MTDLGQKLKMTLAMIKFEHTLFALPFALAVDPATGKRYFWEIMLPGSMVGLIVGFLTQRYGVRPQPAGARA